MSGPNKWIGWGISTLALWFLNKKSNSSDESSKPNDLNVSSNETKIGSPIPVVLGRCLVKSPIVSYFGDFRADRYTETYAAHAHFNAWPLVFALIADVLLAPSTGTTKDKDSHGDAGFGSNKDTMITPLIKALFLWLLNWLINGRNLKTTIQKGFKYYLGYQFLVCWTGKNMRVRAVFLNEEKVWEGDEAAVNYAGAFTIHVNDDELFGGPDENGGFVGDFRVYLGSDNQPSDGWMVQQMSGSTIPAELKGLTPAYRDFVSVVVPTAYIGKQSTIPTTWIELQNCPNNLGLGQIGEDANPAEVLYEIHTNKDWGLAEDASRLDIDALIKVGQTLADEGVGISVQLNSKSEAADLIDTICEHINGVKYADPRTGKIVFKLIRDDYNTDELQIVDVTNAGNISFTRLDWTQTISNVSAAYTDRKANYEESTIPAVDPANVEINKGVQTTKTYSYKYFTTSENALWAAKRDIYEQAYPLATASIEGNRRLSNVRIGDVIILNWEPYGIKNLLMRVTDVDFGNFVDGVIKIETIEDIFGLAKADFGYSGSTEWAKEDIYPTGVQDFRYLELPWEICQCKDTYVSAFAAKPDSLTQIWTVWRQATGGSFISTNSMDNWSAGGRLVYDIDEFSDVEDLLGFEITDFGGISNLASAAIADIAVARRGAGLLVVDDEIMSYSTLLQLPNGHWYVKGVIRGTFDTVPKKHSAQSNVFFIRSGFYANVTTGGPVCREGIVTTEHYNITTSTVDHDEDFDYLKVKQLITTRRPELPSVPGHIRLACHFEMDKYYLTKVAGDVELSFVERNKYQSFGCVSQDDKKEYWTTLDFAAEGGIDYLVRVSVGADYKEYTITASPFTYSWEQRCNDFVNVIDNTRLELYARKNNLLSYQAQERSFAWTIPTLGDCALTEQDGQIIINTIGTSDRLVLPAGPLSGQEQIMYKDLPIIILGSAVAANTPNAICCNDGSWVLPTGQIMRIKGRGQYDLYTMQAGFLFRSYFVPGGNGGDICYVWDGIKLNERVM